MSVMLGSMKRRRWAQLLESARKASHAMFPWFGVAKPDLSVRRAARNATRKSGPSTHQVRLGS
jgi:hypothetical protein